MATVLTFVMGLLFLHSWKHARETPALAYWGVGYLAGGLGSILMALRFHVPDIISVGCGNGLVIAAFGLCWSGFRSFEGREPAIGWGLLGSLTFLLVCLTSPVMSSMAVWMTVGAGTIGVYLALIIRELWRGRSEILASRRLLTLFEIGHACFQGVSVVLIFFVTLPVDLASMQTSQWLSIKCFGSTAFAVATAILMMAMVKERAERGQRLAAETDALTGIANRRAFVAKAEQGCADLSRSVALLLLDLDHFKAINDTYGHAVGDEVLVAFSRIVRSGLPREATFGRLGGEEFACMIEGARLDEAVRVAEQLRARTASIVLPRHRDLAIRVSIGIALKPKDRADGVDALIRRADEALYRAKHAGRNRVECGRDPMLDRAA